MIVNRPEDRVKVLVLIPSVIAVLLYFIFGVLPMMAKMRADATPVSTPAEPTASNAPSTTSAPDAVAPVPASSSPMFVDMPPPEASTNDPFKPPAALPATAAELANQAPAAATKVNPAVSACSSFLR